MFNAALLWRANGDFGREKALFRNYKNIKKVQFLKFLAFQTLTRSINELLYTHLVYVTQICTLLTTIRSFGIETLPVLNLHAAKSH